MNRNAAFASPDHVYAEDFFDYLQLLEVKPHRRPMPDVQTDINSRFRGILVDWLILVADKHNLSSDMLYLSISCIDRYLSSKALPREKLQLLGVSAILVSMKYEEVTKKPLVFCPEKLAYVTHDTYTKDEVIDMESDVLNTLEFDLSTPTVRTILRRFNELSLEDDQTSDQKVELLGCYLSELSLLEYSCVQYVPSLVGASAVFLARFITLPSIHPWCLHVERNTGYQANELKGCVEILHELFLGRRGRSLHSVKEKYEKNTFNRVARIPAPVEIPSNFFEAAEE